MAYTKQVWRDLETGGTPITAARLNHMEDGIEENSNNWDSISQTLFENEQGTKGAITLSDSAANYDYLEFFWKHDDGACGSQRIADPNGKTIGINATSATSYGYLWFAYKGMNISGTQCTLNTDHAVGELGFTNDGTLQRQKQDKLGITKVIGYKLS